MSVYCVANVICGSNKGGRTYAPTVDQARFAAKFDLAMARERVASFAKLWRDLDRIVAPYLDP
jgi:hypothetical protein